MTSATSAASVTAPDISLFRLTLLRGIYLLIVFGLCFQVLPGFFFHDGPFDFMEGAVDCMLTAFALLSAVGLRYPLQMLPILFWEVLWKAIWLLGVALPEWRAGQLDPVSEANVFYCSLIVLVVIAIPWRYVGANYFTKSADRWR